MLDAILLVAVLIVSVVIHENAHGWVAYALGDPTAKAAGRLTLNPVKHLDPVGSVILPAVLALARGPVMGYAKPVPVSPHRLRGRDRWGFALVALAGPASNFVLAFAGVLALKGVLPRDTFGRLNMDSFTDSPGAVILQAIVGVNLVLAAFNLLPIPPLDGSRLLRLVLRPNGLQVLDRIEPYGFLILFLLFVLLPQPLFRLVDLIQSVLIRLLPF